MIHRFIVRSKCHTANETVGGVGSDGNGRRFVCTSEVDGDRLADHGCHGRPAPLRRVLQVAVHLRRKSKIGRDIV